MTDRDDAHTGDDETPWLSFSDAVTALLFVFIATTFWFMFRLEQARHLLEQRIDEQTEEVKKLKGADEQAGMLLEGTRTCLMKSPADGIQVRPVIEPSTHTMSLYIEPQATTLVEWFQACSAEVTPEAAQVVALARSCLAQEIPEKTNDYTVLLTLEGHTDARSPSSGACRERFPSNWELSGARAGAALRRLMCDDGSCGDAQQEEADKLRLLAQDRARLQLVAAGRADSLPAWRALCEWGDAKVDPALDSRVCGLLNADPAAALRDGSLLRAVLGSPIGSLRPALATGDDAMIAWANDPRCFQPGADTAVCEKRLTRLRRVDMRVDLRPRAGTK